ncbi:class I SAM-dependent methyltransferase, partial [Klebsiella pneumoniae]
YCRQQYRPFLDAIRKEMRKAQFAIVREEGCGIATITKILAQDADLEKFDFYAFDVNPDQVQNAVANLAMLSAHVQVQWMNILKDTHTPVDIIHSHGVLEHFPDEDIDLILARQKADCPVLVHYVPLDGWETKSYGDERLLSIDYWVDRFKPSEWFTFNDGKDAVLIWRR